MNISGDCMLETGTCVFCYYHITSWDSNGILVTKQEAITNRCPNCLRNIPNQSWLTNKGCKWCDIEYNRRKHDKTHCK